MHRVINATATRAAQSLLARAASGERIPWVRLLLCALLLLSVLWVYRLHTADSRR